MIRWIAIIILISACGVRVVQFVNTRSDFGAYHSYALVGLKGKNVAEASDPSDLLGRIESRIESEMTRRGYRKDDNPDLILRYEVIASSKTETNNNNSIFYPGYFGPTSRTITESVILLEMTDFKTSKLVWQASLDLREHNKITKKKDVLQAAIVNIFNTYLYRAGQRTPDESLYMK